MSEVDQNLKAFADDFMTLLAANAGDQSHTAGIVLIPWVIKTLRPWSVETTIRCMHGDLLNELCGAVTFA
jgi:hypothetical protein